MTRIPAILVQLVHIQGPLQGQIQEFADPEIAIGRHPDCQVRFPADFTIISRRHARIVREGNRFRIEDESTNGTFLNGKKIQTAWLKDGDVLIFAEGGPKVSFLTRAGEEREEEVPPPRPQAVRPAPPEPVFRPAPEPVRKAPEPPPPVQRTKVPLVIQYGPTLRSFTELPVTLGRHPGVDFVLDHPAVLDRHAQLFFRGDRYWVKDLTGQGKVTVDGRPAGNEAPLDPESVLGLDPGGPFFKFLGGGRLAELEPPAPEPVAQEPKEEKPVPRDSSIFSRFLKR